ncbi:hypothetical protein EDB85DRAFT_2278261 [Lactarius pseudohatsudake]|nr:hypothetical protein EDB85DRAFT_2278261 [Lactarius pseudohatsudake]
MHQIFPGGTKVVREVRSRSWGHGTCGLALYWSNNVPGGITISGVTEEATFAGRERGRDRCVLARGFRRGQIAIASNVLGWGDRPRHGRESRNQGSGSGTSWAHTDAYTLDFCAASIRDRHLGYHSVPGLTSSGSGWSGGSGARLGDRIRLCQRKFGKMETTCLRPVGSRVPWARGCTRANPARANHLCPWCQPEIGRMMYHRRHARH